jgi:hypothetical protein
VDPQSSSALTGSSSLPTFAESQNAKVEMVFRFWGSSAKSADAPAGEGAAPHHPGVLALIEDAVAAKRGVFLSARDQLYVSGLKQPADALVVSRQVQLGLQGFRGKHASGPIAVSIAIDASGAANQPKPDTENAGDSRSSSSSANQTPEPPHELVTLLKLSKPAQILLTHDLCEQLAAIKGLPLKSFPGRFGVYEYLWTAEEKLDLLQSEPQLTLAALPAASPSPRAKDKTSSVQAADQPVKTAAATQNHADMVAEKRSAFQLGFQPWFQSPRMLILGAVAVVVLVTAILVGAHLAHTPSANSAPISAPQPASPQQTSAPAPVAAPVAVQSVAPTSSEKPHATATPSRQASKSTAHQPAQAEEKRTTPAPAPAANCTLGANPERFVGLAEQARGRGDYANAIRIFREVLDCDPNNAAAREGLDKATRGEQSQH